MKIVEQLSTYALYFPILVVVLAVFGSLSLLDAQTNVSDDDMPLITAVQKRKVTNLNRETNARIDRVARRDPRYAAYVKDLAKFKRLKDMKEIERLLPAFTAKYQDFRDDVMRKAKVNVKDYNLKLKKILPRIQLDDNGVMRKAENVSFLRPAPAAAGNSSPWLQNATYSIGRDTTQVFTSFPNKTTYQTCSQANTYYNGSGDVESYSHTNVDDNDCEKVRASRGVKVNIPSGVQRVRIEIEIDQYHFYNSIACYGFVAYGYAYTSVGIRFHYRPSSLSFYKRHASGDAEWSVYGTNNSSKTVSNVVLSGTFYPYGAGEYDIQAFARTTVDTDGFAAATADSEIDGISKITVTLER